MIRALALFAILMVQSGAAVRSSNIDEEEEGSAALLLQDSKSDAELLQAGLAKEIAKYVEQRDYLNTKIAALQERYNKASAAVIAEKAAKKASQEDGASLLLEKEDLEHVETKANMMPNNWHCCKTSPSDPCGWLNGGTPGGCGANGASDCTGCSTPKPNTPD